MGLGDIIEGIKDAITGGHNNDAAEPAADNMAYADNNAGYTDNTMGNNDGGILPASQDPLGDPADQQTNYDNTSTEDGILPASQDPLGDPADEPQR